MDFVKDIGIDQERGQTGLRAKMDRPAAMVGPVKIGGIRIPKNPAAEGYETRMSLAVWRICWHGILGAA
jgi:hypothetical protein